MMTRAYSDDQEFEINGFTFPAYGMDHILPTTSLKICPATPIRHRHRIDATYTTARPTRKKPGIRFAIADKGTKRRLQRHIRGRKAGLGELNFLLWRQSRR